MKIAIFSGSIPTATFIEHVIEGVSREHSVYLFGVIERPFFYKSKNIKVFHTPKSHLSNLIISSCRFVLLLVKAPQVLYRLLKEVRKYSTLYERWIWFTKFLPIALHKPDILHLQWARDIPFYGFFKEVINCKLVVSLLGSHINYSPIVDHKLLNQYIESFPDVDAFHAVSDAIIIESLKYGVAKSKVKLIKSPILEITFDMFRLPQKNQSIRLVSIGRHHWVKGYNYALQSIHILKSMGYKCSYTIIAQGTIPEELIFLRSQLQLEQEVLFKPGVESQLQLFSEMHHYDSLLLPSLSEGIANVVLEAMALGLPVISTNCGGMSEVVHLNETGWLVPIRDPLAIAQAVIEVYKTPEQELQRITSNAHDFVKTNFYAPDKIDEFIEWYEQLYELK